MEQRSSYTRVRITDFEQETRYSLKHIYLVEWESRDGSKDTEMIIFPLVNAQEEQATLDELMAFLSEWECTINSENDRVYENTK